MSALGALLRRVREESGLTQEELAERAGVSARTITDTERGLRGRLYADTAGRLAAGLGLNGSARDSFVEVARSRADAAPDAGAVPHPLTPLLGRSDELTAVVEDLQPGGRRLVTLTGLGGVDKTRLAVAAAEALAPAYEGRVHMVRLAPGSDPARLVDMVAAALGTAPSSVAAGVAGRPTLVVLDAFEHILPATERSVTCSAGRLTSTLWSPVGSSFGHRSPAAGSWPAPAETAAALFLDRVHDLTPQQPQDPVVVADICRLVNGLPLPLELVAAHVRYLPLGLIRDRLRSRLADSHRWWRRRLAGACRPSLPSSATSSRRPRPLMRVGRLPGRVRQRRQAPGDSPGQGGRRPGSDRLACLVDRTGEREPEGGRRGEGVPVNLFATMSAVFLV